MHGDRGGVPPTRHGRDLPPMAVAARAHRLAGRLAGIPVDGLLVTHDRNIRYLTGYTGSAGLLLVTPSGLTLVTDGRYVEQAAHELAAAGVEATIESGRSEVDRRDLLRSVAGGVHRLGLEAEHVSWARHREFASTWFAGAELVPTAGLVESLREVKDEGEVARIEAAASIADAALAAVRHSLADGVTEREFAFALEAAMRRLGADGSGFDPIVASGPNGAMPHARPSHRPIGEGDLVVIDVGALVDGYRSDLTRTICVGDPTPTQRRMLEVVTAAQAAGVAGVSAGVPAADIDRACRDLIAEAGWREAFLHTTGHGIGLDLHELPWVEAGADATLVAGHVVTIEPGVYLPDHGGVRVEDILVVGPGGARPLTASPKHWTV